jgi:hypothetical protein
MDQKSSRKPGTTNSTNTCLTSSTTTNNAKNEKSDLEPNKKYQNLSAKKQDEDDDFYLNNDEEDDEDVDDEDNYGDNDDFDEFMDDTDDADTDYVNKFTSTDPKEINPAGKIDPSAAHSLKKSETENLSTSTLSQRSALLAAAASRSKRNVDLDDEFKYEVLTPDKIVQHMIECIKEVNQVLELPPTTTRILLHHFRWDKEKLMERFYDGDQDRLFKEAHIVSPFKSFSRKVGRIL